MCSLLLSDKDQILVPDIRHLYPLSEPPLTHNKSYRDISTTNPTTEPPLIQCILFPDFSTKHPTT